MLTADDFSRFLTGIEELLEARPDLGDLLDRELQDRLQETAVALRCEEDKKQD
jgi:hypothetical protein